jgi:TolB protein
MRRARSGWIVFAVLAFSFGVVSTQAHAAAPAAPGRIVFISDRTGNPEVWIINRAGANPTQVTSSPEVESHPQLSPGGAQIVFERAALSNTTFPNSVLWVMNADGTDPHEVFAPAVPDGGLAPPSVYRDRDPTWSPDGTQIAFVRDGIGIPTGILVMNADGTDLKVIRSSPQPERLVNPALSPDGTKIAYSDDLIGPAAQFIVVSKVDGSGSFELTKSPFHNPFTDVGIFDDEPAWSPDGKQIAFVGVLTRGGPQGIWTINADGSNPVLVTQGGGSPSWSPEGQRIAFDRSSSIWTMKSDGTHQENLTAGEQANWAPKK